MFQRILVPLDGSARAESAISVAAKLALASGGSVILLRVITASTEYAWSAMESPTWMQEPLEADRVKVVNYLSTIAESKALAGIETKIEAVDGLPADTILSVARSQQVDLIVMCSHGYTGFKRWALGSVTQKIARHSSVPVFVLQEGAGVPTNLHPGGPRPVRVLVALDGSPLAETVLAPAAQLSTALSAPAPGALHLARVLPLASLPEQDHVEPLVKVRDMARAEADAYLRAIEQRLREGELAPLQLSITSSVVINTDIAETLIKMAENGEYMDKVGESSGCDVIAMATHGRGGLQRWVMGSITERVLEATKLPLLIVRPPKADDTTEKDKETIGVAERETQTWVGLL
jgi:nucleotide-binding universal stress UspA family protein